MKTDKKDSIVSDEQVRKIVARFKLESDEKPEVRLSNQQLCEDLLEIIGVPTHTRKEVCSGL